MNNAPEHYLALLNKMQMDLRTHFDLTYELDSMFMELKMYFIGLIDSPKENDLLSVRGINNTLMAIQDVSKGGGATIHTTEFTNLILGFMVTLDQLIKSQDKYK
jgi:hypothetical protein